MFNGWSFSKPFFVRSRRILFLIWNTIHKVGDRMYIPYTYEPGTSLTRLTKQAFCIISNKFLLERIRDKSSIFVHSYSKYPCATHSYSADIDCDRYLRLWINPHQHSQRFS
ncbi:conserved hypothetical protein [Trichinella spiralis]|uniref:hypothetical protein n=1 Tax=Trichinella spiralis TaxID=6334 RepID=UPI0001EFDC78|nr:conserved hypothetical protein [Trichinella spiralis]